MMKGSQLDFCLSKGYFRMQQVIFTCRFLLFNNRLCSVHWLRIAVGNVTYGAKQRRLLRLNEKFLVAIKPFALTEEIEILYALYKSTVDFDAPDSVESWLLDGAIHNAFDTYVIEVRDENRLIAAGIFDTDLASALPERLLQMHAFWASAGRLGRPEELAEYAAFMVSDRNSFMNGEVVIVDGGAIT